MIIVLIGPPGSGKSTQGRLLSHRYQLPFVGVGDLVRELIHSKESEYECKVNSGNLLPDDVVFQIVRRELDRQDLQKGLVMEGYPRTVGQAMYLDQYLSEQNVTLNLVLYLNNVLKHDLAKRISGRYQCSCCGATYSKESTPQDLICERCSTSLILRKDDSETSLVCRMDEYHKKSLPVCQYYEKTHRLYPIDGSKPIDSVAQSAITIIEKEIHDITKE